MIEKMEIDIWDRQLTIPVEYDCYEGEEITSEQIKTMDMFALHADWINKAKPDVEKYCYECVMSDITNNKKDNIFSYIQPEYFFVKRTKKEPRIALMCRYRYDPEHGLAIVFNLMGEYRIGTQDLIL